MAGLFTVGLRRSAFAVVVAVFSSSLLLAVASASSYEHVALVAQREFDFFVLALQWTGTVCQTTHKCCSANGCCRSTSLPEFTIHGLWTDYDDGTWPSCCSHNKYDPKKIEPLEPEIEKYWPSLYCTKSKLCFGSGKGPFWAHEWEKHGTCSYPVIKNEYDYFSTALNLYKKYNMAEALNKAGILATNSNNYLLGDILEAINDAFGATPVLVCDHGSLKELRLCLTKDFKPRECVERNSCPRSISLPIQEPLGLAGVGSGLPSAW